MYAILLSSVALILQLFPPVVSISSPGALTREVGQNVVFMFNASNNIRGFSWGIRDGDTSNLKHRLIYYDAWVGMKLDDKINSSSYAGRVSFVGNLSEGQVWFKITNLNINDTNQYMASIAPQGAPGYQYVSVQLTVIQPVTTRPLLTSTTESTPAASSYSPTTPRPTTSRAPELSNQSVSIKVVREVRGDLSDPNSTAFRIFSQNFVSEINSVYKTVDNFEKAKVTSLSENSIPVKFVVYFNNTTKPDEYCAPLHNAVKDNRLGSLKIVPGSLGCSGHDEPSRRSTKNQSSPVCNCTSIIAACVTINILLILAVVVLLIYVWRLRSNIGKGTGSRSSSTQEKDLEAYENAHPMENTLEAIITQTETPRAEKELYETINENRDKAVRVPSAGTKGDIPSLPQHYQELQTKAPNTTPLYEPLKQRDFDNKGEGPQTYEQLQQRASGGEYQSLSKCSYKDTESKV